jgi:predicted ATP-grasp superfamily ATP-dependent carboligase
MTQSSPIDSAADERQKGFLGGPASNGVAGAIVVGGDYQGLGIVRSLGRHGVPICVIDDQHSIARYSRYTSHYVRVRELRDEARSVEQVIEIGQRLGLRGWVLFPTREETVAAFSQSRDELSKYFRVPTPAWGTVSWAWDKRNTYKLANELGICAPATWYVRNSNELAALNVSFPVAIKPAIKEHFIYATKAKAWRANDWDELRILYSKAAGQVGEGEVMIQDLIPGDGSRQFAYCAFFKDGSSIGKLMARRLRQHPSEFGRATTYAETVDVPELQLLSEKFLRAIDYYGLVELEYKLDPRDGRLKLLDVNARTWGYHTIGAAAGVDFPYMLFLDQMRQPIEPCEAAPGVSWVRLVTDLPTAIVDILSSRLNWRHYLRTLRKAPTDAVFCQDDFMPGLIELGLIPYLYLKRGF